MSEIDNEKVVDSSKADADYGMARLSEVFETSAGQSDYGDSQND